MRRSVRRAVAGLLVLLLGASGCQTLNKESTFELDARNSPMKIEVSAPSTDQKVTVTVTASLPVSAFLCTKENAEQVENETFLVAGPKKDLLLGSKQKEKEFSFDATVPAKKPFVLMVTADKTTKVTVKIVGK
jgi:hypothetical protein